MCILVKMLADVSPAAAAVSTPCESTHTQKKSCSAELTDLLTASNHTQEKPQIRLQPTAISYRPLKLFLNTGNNNTSSYYILFFKFWLILWFFSTLKVGSLHLQESGLANEMCRFTYPLHLCRSTWPILHNNPTYHTKHQSAAGNQCSRVQLRQQSEIMLEVHKGGVDKNTTG